MFSTKAATRCFHFHHRQWQQWRTPTWSTCPTEVAARSSLARSTRPAPTAASVEMSERASPVRNVMRRWKDMVSVPSSLSPAISFRNFDKGVLGWYLSMIEKRPVVTKSISASVIFAAADISSQVITHAFSDSIDLVRTLRMAGYGLLILGPVLNLWFNFISRILPRRDMISTLKKIFIGQVVFGPVMTAIFFSTNAILQGECITEIVARLNRDLYPTMINGLVYWPMADFITFKFIPVRLQPIVSNSFSFFWTIYLTQIASSRNQIEMRS